MKQFWKDYGELCEETVRSKKMENLIASSDKKEEAQ